ncbi:MAG: DEAD/DEAH box helicase, partial [Planctomycetota bacterium]
PVAPPAAAEASGPEPAGGERAANLETSAPKAKAGITLRPFDDWPEVRVEGWEDRPRAEALESARGLEGPADSRRQALRMDPAELALFGETGSVDARPAGDAVEEAPYEDYVVEAPRPAGREETWERPKRPPGRRRDLAPARSERSLVEERFPSMGSGARKAIRAPGWRSAAYSGEPRDGTRILRIPPGPPGLVYLVQGGGPISGTGVLRIFYRHPAKGGDSSGAPGEAGNGSDDSPGNRVESSSVVTPVPVDRDLAKRSHDALDQNIISVVQKLPRHAMVVEHQRVGKGAGGKKKAQARRPRAVTKSDPCATVVTEKAWRVLLPWLLESGRCYAAAPGAAEAVPLVLDPQPPLEFHLLVDRIPRRGDYHLTCRFVRAQKILLYRSQLLLVTDGEKGFLLRRSGKISSVDFGGSASWLRALRRGKFRHVSRKKVPTLLKTFDRSTTLPPMHIPSSLKIQKLEGLQPMPELHLDSGQQEVSAEVTFRYGEDSVRGARAGKRFFSLKTRHLITRNLDAEAAHAVDLLRQGFAYDPNTHRFTLSADKLPQAAAALFGMGWTLHGKKMPFRPPTDMEVNVTTGPDYIDVDVKVHFGDEHIDVTQLLEAIQAGNRMVTLKGGALGVLPGDWLDRNAAWMELGQLYEGKLRFRRVQSALIDALVADKIKARLDEGFHAERSRLATFEGIRDTNPSPGFKGVLRTYQKLGLGWLLFLDKMAWGGCLADDMGLGKTVQTLALLQLLKEGGRQGTSLIVTPKSLIFNWFREAKRFTPGIKVLNYTGFKRTSTFESFPEYDVVITTYGTMRRDAEKLSQFRFFYLILDEAQAIKNAESQNAKAASLLQGERRLILSGTPVENHLGELWSLFDFINPGMLGSYSAFKKRFANGKTPDAGSIALLRKTLRPFILRRKKEEVAPDLPEKVEDTILCEMEPEQKQVYQEVKDRCRNSILALVKAKGIARSKLHILEALLRLRQAACHPALIDQKHAELPSGKISAFISMVEEVQEAGHKVLVFSQFTSLLAIVRKEMEKLGMVYEYLDGQTRDRAARVDRFQTDPDCRFFLISLKAGGLGLNLTAADYVFILDPWWNPAVEAQAIDRAHRIGQDKKVFAYRFVSKDSIEEHITEMQESKRKLADAIVAADESFIRNLTREDLEVLFS